MTKLFSFLFSLAIIYKSLYCIALHCIPSILQLTHITPYISSIQSPKINLFLIVFAFISKIKSFFHNYCIFLPIIIILIYYYFFSGKSITNLFFVLRRTVVMKMSANNPDNLLSPSAQILGSKNGMVTAAREISLVFKKRLLPRLLTIKFLNSLSSNYLLSPLF